MGEWLIPVLSVMSGALFLANTALFALARHRDDSKLDMTAWICGLVGALVWTVCLWPAMTGQGTGGYIVYLGVGVVPKASMRWIYGLMPLFFADLALCVAPRALGYVLARLSWIVNGQRRYRRPDNPSSQINKIVVVVGCFLFCLTMPAVFRAASSENGRMIYTLGVVAILALVICGLSYVRRKER